MRPRYYCDHCNKGNEGGPEPAPNRDALVKIMDADGFKAMCAAANDCPACILSALRTKNFKGDAETPPGVLGPEDGRETWSYKAAKESWWADFNSGKAEKEGPYY
jgi:hypothetical protein